MRFRRQGEMKGYKGFNSDLTCLDFQYEVGKTYHQDGDLQVCSNGFHFCKNLTDCFEFYDKNARKRSTRVCGSLLDVLDNIKLGGNDNGENRKV